MPAPYWLARFNRRVTNRLTGPFAPHLAGFGVIVHAGRTSGREYRTPINIFRRDGDYVIALTYGPRSDWVRNVVASGGCTLVTRGRSLRLIEPRLIRDERHQAIPAPIRPALRLMKIDDFLVLKRADAPAGS